MRPLRSIILNFVVDWSPKDAGKPSEPEPDGVTAETASDADRPAPASSAADEPAPMPAAGSSSPQSPWLIGRKHSADAPADPAASRWLLGEQRPRGSRPRTPVAVLAARRKRAVEAYCAEFCSPALVEKTAAEVLTEARASAGGPPTDQGLLAAARAVAATHPPVGAPSQPECSQTPSLLAARAGGGLANGELAALERHLAGCLVCQATELKSTRAERVFATAISSADPAEAIAEPATPSDEPAPLPSGPAQTATAIAPRAPAPQATPIRRDRRHRRALVLGALVALAAAAGGAVALLSSGHDESRPTPTAVSTTRTTPARAARHHAKHHRRHAAPRHRHRHRHAAATTSASAPAASAPSSGSAAAGASGAGASTPAASSGPAAQSTPPASSGSSAGSSQGNGGAGGGSAAAVQQGGLPAQSAPTQGIGSGGSGH
jgi:hypothetical protein